MLPLLFISLQSSFLTNKTPALSYSSALKAHVNQTWPLRNLIFLLLPGFIIYLLTSENWLKKAFWQFYSKYVI